MKKTTVFFKNPNLKRFKPNTSAYVSPKKKNKSRRSLNKYCKKSIKPNNRKYRKKHSKKLDKIYKYLDNI